MTLKSAQTNRLQRTRPHGKTAPVPACVGMVNMSVSPRLERRNWRSSRRVGDGGLSAGRHTNGGVGGRERGASRGGGEGCVAASAMVEGIQVGNAQQGTAKFATAAGGEGWRAGGGAVTQTLN